MASAQLFQQAPEFRPLRHDVYEALREAILLGRLAPGQRIVEAEVARQMGISRGPIREAIRQLEQDGLLEYHPRRGAVVSSLSLERIIDAYTARAALEALAARLASQRLTAPGIARLTHLLDAMRGYAQQEDFDRLLQADVQFHELICELSGNRILLRLWKSIGPHAWTLFSGAHQRGYSLHDLAERHQDVLAALQAGDPERAAEVAAAHIEEIMRHVVNSLPAGTTTGSKEKQDASAHGEVGRGALDVAPQSTREQS